MTAVAPDANGGPPKMMEPDLKQAAQHTAQLDDNAYVLEDDEVRWPFNGPAWRPQALSCCQRTPQLQASCLAWLVDEHTCTAATHAACVACLPT